MYQKQIIGNFQVHTTANDALEMANGGFAVALTGGRDAAERFCSVLLFDAVGGNPACDACWNSGGRFALGIIEYPAGRLTVTGRTGWDVTDQLYVQSFIPGGQGIWYREYGVGVGNAIELAAYTSLSPSKLVSNPFITITISLTCWCSGYRWLRVLAISRSSPVYFSGSGSTMKAPYNPL